MADALSSMFEAKEETEEYYGLTIVQPKWASDITDNYDGDQDAQHILVQMLIDTNGLPTTTVQNGIIRINGKVFNAKLREKLIDQMHSTY